MNTPLTRSSGSKPSFASIAAMAPSTQKENKSYPRRDVIVASKTESRTGPSSNPIGESASATSQNKIDLQNSMSRLTVEDSGSKSTPKVEGDNSVGTRAGPRFDDDQTHVSASSTKPASLDEKSTTSGMTFALDEKESLRPDDSASAKAAEEEDSYSGPASGAASSWFGSETGGRAFRDQFNEISEKMRHAPYRSNLNSRREITGIEEERSYVTVPSIAQAISATGATNTGTVADSPVLNGGTFRYEYHEPDEKLFEALESPKDRLFVLRLEQEIIAFIRNSKEPEIVLPPCNSFCRLLAHKLGDYYALTHFVDNAQSAVKLFRTPYCRLPTPLKELSRVPVSNETPPSTQPAMKIMRRKELAKDGNNIESGATTAASSIPPSKEGSETSDESQPAPDITSPTDSNMAREKATLTREEREAKYKETRDRIFKGFEDSENNDINHGSEEIPGISRTSSSSGKKRSRKHRNIDDGFQARSQFNAYFPTMQFPAPAFDQPMAPSPYFNPYVSQHTLGVSQVGAQSPPVYQQSFSHGYQNGSNIQGYPMQIQQYPVLNNPAMSGFNGNTNPPYMQQMPPQFYQQTNSPAMGQQSPSIPSPALSTSAQLSRHQSQMPEQQWSTNGYSNPYQQQPRVQQQMYFPAPQDRNMVTSVPTIPYQYGQLPYQTNMSESRNAHPLPGSYNRQSFNPQTRSFVPSMMNGNSAPSPLNYLVNDAASSTVPSSYMNSTSTSVSVSQSSTPGQHSVMPQFGSFTQDLKTPVLRKTVPQPNNQPGSAQSSLAKWGTPANLPPKPPPPEAPSISEGQHALPQNVPSHTNIQIMNNGQPRPIFQNGIYSIPGQTRQ